LNFFLFDNGPVEAFIAIFSQIKTLCFYTLFGQSILEIQFFDIFYMLIIYCSKIKKKSEIFSFFSKIQCIHCFFWTISKKPKTSCSHALLEGVFVTVLQSYCRVKSLCQFIIAWLGVIRKYLSPEDLGNHTDGASKI